MINMPLVKIVMFAGFQVLTVVPGVKDIVCLLSCQEIDESAIIV